MHTRLLQVMAYPESDAPEVQAIVRLSRSWHTLTEVHSGRQLTRVRNTPRWSHGGGLFADTTTGDRFTVQSLWPITAEPDLWPDDESEGDDSSFSWTIVRRETDAAAEAREKALERAERHKAARAMRRPPADPADRITIRLMPKYGVDWPLWGPEGPLEPWELALPIHLTADLHAWFARWDRSFHWERGWTDEEDRRAFERDRPSIAARIATAIAAFAVLDIVE